MNIKSIVFKIFLFLLLILTAGCGNNSVAPADDNMEEQTINKKVLMVIAPQNFKDVEYSATRQQLKESDVQVEVASVQEGTAVGVDGTEVEVGKMVSEVDPQNYDAVAFIGGPGMAKIVEDDTLQLTAQRFREADKFVSAICIAPVILANSGILENKEATVFPDGEEQLKQAGAQLKDKPVVVDGKIVTGNGPDAGEEFGRTLAEELNK